MFWFHDMHFSLLGMHVGDAARGWLGWPAISTMCLMVFACGWNLMECAMAGTCWVEPDVEQAKLLLFNGPKGHSHNFWLS